MQIIPFLSFLLFPHRPAFHPWSGRHPRGALPVRTRRLWRWGGEVAQRIAAPLDVWMLKWNLLFMNLFTVVPVVKENVSFFVIFLALPWIFVIEQETFHSLCGGKPWFSSGRRSGEIPSSLPLCSAHSSKVPHSRLSWAAVYPAYDLGPDSGTLIIKCEENCDIGSHLLLYVSRFETFLSKTDQIVMGIDSCDCAQHTSLPCFWMNFPALLRY